VGWGDAGFELGTAGQQSGALPLNHHTSLTKMLGYVSMQLLNLQSGGLEIFSVLKDINASHSLQIPENGNCFISNIKIYRGREGK
jgi:hypothetical protein